MKVFIFGASGMLGGYVTKYLSSEFEVVPITRNEVDLQQDFSLITEKYDFQSDDVIVNAAGIIKQRNYSPEELIRVNSLFPHFLSTLKCNVIHITTDCVFSGKDGSYTEDSLHDCLDDYGKSKSLGENSNLTIIRTSIIGEELHNKKSLIEWVKSNQNTTINGYINHFWNGVTCLELSKQIKKIIRSGFYWNGIRHYYSPDTVSKYQLVSYINEVYKLNINVIPVKSKHCDRSLLSNYKSPIKKTIKEQLLELKNFRINKLNNFPSINFISIEESKDRRNNLYENFKHYELTNIRSNINKKYEEGDCKIEFPENYTFEFNELYLGAFTSHLKAIKNWYENTDEPYAFFCEDDLSFETVEYWNFTWEEFFSSLPSDWSCVQLGLTRYVSTMFNFFQPEVHLRNRCFCDWGCFAYLISRDHAKRLLDNYYDGQTFVFNYKGIDKNSRFDDWASKPGIETIIYSYFGDTIYTFPLFVENYAIFDTLVWDGKGDFYRYSYECIINWWKDRGRNLKVEDLIKVKPTHEKLP